MAKIISILSVALIFEAVGVVLISRGLKQLGPVEKITLTELSRVVVEGATNRCILLGVFFEALFFLGFLILLAQADVSLVWPLTSLGFLFTTLAAQILGHEQVTSLRWTGVCLIALGAALVGWSEKQVLKPPGGPTAARMEGNRPESD